MLFLEFYPDKVLLFLINNMFPMKINDNNFYIFNDFFNCDYT